MPDAVDLLVAVYGEDKVVLQGFGSASAAQGIWTHPSIPFVSAPISPMDLVPTLQRSALHRRVLHWSIFVACGCALFSLGMLATWSKLSDTVGRAARPLRNLEWSVSQVDSRGVHIRTGGDTTTFVPVGDRLPNGEILISVLPERATVVLSSGTLVLRTAVKERAGGN